MKQILYKLFEHQYLGRSEARDILQNIAQGKYSDAQIASLITVFLMRNISVEELCGFRDALLDMRIPVDLNEFSPIDIVGTGGDRLHSFNISTTSMFVLAAAGGRVAKHGNRAVSSSSGSADALEALGVNLAITAGQVGECIDELGVGFMFAPNHHSVS